MSKKEEITTIIESLSPNERKIISFLREKSMEDIAEKAELNKAAVLRSLEFLSNKDIIKIKSNKKKIIELGVNGLLYKEKSLPERILINLISENSPISLGDAKKQSNLSDNEFKAALGVLKKKAVILLDKGKIKLNEKKENIIKKTLEEQLIEQLPLEYDKLEDEQRFAVESLKNRKDIININDKNIISFKLTKLGEKLISEDLSSSENMIEVLTPEIIKSNSYKNKKFRRYDISSQVPKITGGKRHFVNQAIDYGRKIWTELGFQEMTGDLIQTGFWNFDALFQPQDHPARELADTFYIKNLKGKLPEKNILNKVKKAHESGVKGSKGWQYSWKEQEAEKVLLRPHTTCLSSRTLYKLSKLPKEQRKGKFFAIGKCFRNETVDWSHGFEFNQTEGIVIDPDANFRNLLGYLKEFFRKMGFEKVRFAPAYFPYTEPSVEISAYHPEKKVWLELGGSGIFRPEVVVPLLGEWIPILAWGPGFDRTLMDYYKIQDLRELYANNLTKLRQKKAWMKS